MSDYPFLCQQLKSLCDGVSDRISVLSNSAALLYDTLPDINWAGFYLTRGNTLRLGPFIGKPACVEIPFGRGVCGTAARSGKTIVVPDVHEFPGHIACDAASRSEIVIPITVGSALYGVLDIDSPLTDRFSPADKNGLEAFVLTLETILSEISDPFSAPSAADIVLDTIRERRSIRRFKPELPPRELIDKIIEAGLYAPSGRGMQATMTIAVTNREFRDRLAVVNASFWNVETDDPFFGAPVVLIVLGNRKRPTYLYDGSLVMGNMMLAAHALGLGSVWIHRAKQEFEMPEYKDLIASFGVGGDWEGIGHCCVGYVDGPMPVPANRRKNRVFFIE